MIEDKRTEAISLAEFQWLMLDRTSSSPVIQKMTGEIVDLMKKDKKITVGTGDHLAKLEGAISMVLCNLIYTWSVYSELYVAFRGESGWWTGKRFGHRHVDRVKKFLFKKGYIDLKPGYKAVDGGESHVSKMRATDKLVALAGDNPNSIAVYRDKTRLEDLVVRKGKKPKKDKDGTQKPRKVIDTPRTSRALELAEEIKTVNRVNREAQIQLNIDLHELGELERKLTSDGARYTRHLDFTRTQMHRTFHESRKLDQHGRWYGTWWQEIHEDLRHRIWIKDNPVVEIDYSYFHPSMLYCERYTPGVQIPQGDLYLIPERPKDKSWRTLLKKLTLIMLNANSEGGAIYALKESYREAWYKAEKWDKDPPISPVPLDEESLLPIITDILERHAPIKDHFLTGIGNKLMTEDAEIATEVLLHFAGKGIPCLPVHDSFLVVEKHSLECWRVMQDVFKKRFGQECRIDYQDAVDVYKRYRDKPSALRVSKKWDQKEAEIHDVLCEDVFGDEDRGR